MALTPGTRLGPYEVTAQIGVGGMGEVYRARDTGLNRDVALKVLPEAFASDAERLARFTREAQTLASLNHPNIAHIHGLEESAGLRALVMELVEGDDLAAVIARGPMPLADALPIAKQIADALEAAHDLGIIHRDVKPANVKVRDDGVVKVLDFGLAKALDPASASNAGAMDSPTLTARATQVGMILGTAAYMSPEQARGKPVERRADIWAFGCVLYEMLTGQRVFKGVEISDVLAAVLRQDVDWTALPADTPPRFRRLLERCLDRDPKTRLRDIGEARVAIEQWLANPFVADTAMTGTPPALLRRWLVVSAVAVVLSLLAAMAGWWTRGTQAPPFALEPVRLHIYPSEDGVVGLSATVSVSPDGSTFVFPGTGKDGVMRLWTGRIGALGLSPLRGTEGVQFQGTTNLFWSPNSQVVVFAAGGKLRKIDIHAEGSSAQPLCDAPTQAGGGSGGGFWTGDRIVFGGSAGLMQVAAIGGEASPLTVVDRARGERFHSFPVLLPDGVHFLYLRAGSKEHGGIYVGSLDARPEDQGLTRVLDEQTNVAYVPQETRGQQGIGYLLFRHDGDLVARRFDANRMELSPAQVVVAPKISVSATTVPYAVFSASTSGSVIVYRSGVQQNQLTWFDRHGTELRTVGQPGPYNMLTLSADRTSAVTQMNQDVQSTNLATMVTTNVASNPQWDESSPVSYGNNIAFASSRDGVFDLYTIPASGGTETKLLPSSDPRPRNPSDVSRDGRFLLYSVLDPQNDYDIWLLQLGSAAATTTRIIGTDHAENLAQFSPDGRWIAYKSVEQGVPEIYVKRFVSSQHGGVGTSRWKISQGGAHQPRWNPNGKELFYLTEDGWLTAVKVDGAGEQVKTLAPEKLFPARILGGGFSANIFRWDVAGDGQTFLMITPPTTSLPFTVALNWQVALEKK